MARQRRFPSFRPGRAAPFQLVFQAPRRVRPAGASADTFLDDLQWLDAATLGLIEDLLTHRSCGPVLLGAYRTMSSTLAPAQAQTGGDPSCGSDCARDHACAAHP